MCPCSYLGSKFSHPDGGNYIIISIKRKGDDFVLSISRQDIHVENPSSEISWSYFKNNIVNVW